MEHEDTSEYYPMNANKMVFNKKKLHPCALDESSLRIGRVNFSICLEVSSCACDPKINSVGLLPTQYTSSIILMSENFKKDLVFKM